MGLRDRIKGKVKSALGMSEGQQRDPAPVVSAPPESVDTELEEVHEGEETPWYLKYDDLEGWDNTNAKDAVEED